MGHLRSRALVVNRWRELERNGLYDVEMGSWCMLGQLYCVCMYEKNMNGQVDLPHSHTQISENVNLSIFSLCINVCV